MTPDGECREGDGAPPVVKNSSLTIAQLCLGP